MELYAGAGGKVILAFAPEKVKQARFDEALTVQQKVSTEVNQRFLGKKMRVLIDEVDNEDKTPPLKGIGGSIPADKAVLEGSE